MTAASIPHSSGRLRIPFIVVAVLLGLVAAAVFFGVPSLVIGWFDPEEGGIHRVHNIVWGVYMGVFFGVGMLLQAWRPERTIALFQTLAVAALAGLLAALVSADFDAIPIFVVPPILLAALHPVRSALARPGGPISPYLAGFAVLAAIPLLVYFFDQAGLQRTLPGNDPHSMENHWLGTAALALAFPLVGLVVSLRASGWRWAGWFAGGGAALLGLASVVFPEHASSVGRLWGTVMILAGLAFVALVEREARSPEAASAGPGPEPSRQLS